MPVLGLLLINASFHPKTDRKGKVKKEETQIEIQDNS